MHRLNDSAVSFTPHMPDAAHDPSPPNSSMSPSPPRGWLGRVVLVMPGEWRALGWSAAYFFFIMLGYFMMRPVRDAMGIDGSTDKLPMLFAWSLIAMLVASPIYSAIISRLPRRVFIPWAYRFFMVNMAAFYALFQLLPAAAHRDLGDVFYVWLSVFNLFIVSVFWAFMADVFNPAQGKRLFGFIGVGGTLGAMLGALATKTLVSGIHIGTWMDVAPWQKETMLLAACVPLEMAVQCMRQVARASRRDVRGPAAAVRMAGSEPGRSVWAGFALIAGSPYLMLMCAYVFTYALTSTFLYAEQAAIIQKLFPDAAARTAAFADVSIWTNIFTLAMQVLLTARIVRWLGVGGTLAVLPAFTMLGFAALWASPRFELAMQFRVVMAFQVLRSALHYALDRPVRESLYTVLGPDAKYKSKSFIDTFIYRAGDQLGIRMPGWMGDAKLPISVLAVPLAGAWVVVALVLGTMQKRLAAARQD